MAALVGTPTTGGRTATGTFTVALPTGATGFIAAVERKAGSVTPPAGWTLLASAVRDSTWSVNEIYTAAASPGTSWSFTGTGTPAGIAVVILGLDGAPTIVQNANAASLTCPTTAATAGPALIVRAAFNQPAVGTAPTWTYPAAATLGRTSAFQTLSSEGWAVAVAASQQAAAGAPGTAAYSASPTFGVGSWTLAVTTPAGGAPSQGLASGTTAWAGAATGKRITKAAAAGLLAFAGAASGTSVHRASTSGTVAWAGAAVGTSTHRASAAGTVSWTGAATGSAPSLAARSGSAAGTVAWVGSASGSRPTIPTRSGSASGTTTWAGSAAGTRTPRGTVSAAASWAGSATGFAPIPGVKQGSASGVVVWRGAATGARAARANTAGTLLWAGAAAASSTIHAATATGAVSWTGFASGASGDVPTAEPVPNPGLQLTIPQARLAIATDTTLTITGHATLTLTAPHPRLEVT